MNYRLVHPLNNYRVAIAPHFEIRLLGKIKGGLNCLLTEKFKNYHHFSSSPF